MSRIWISGKGLKRRVREKIFGIKCGVTSKEDFILSKLVNGGWQDYTDALGCWLRFQDELDKEYLGLFSEELEVQREYTLLKSGIDDPDEFFNKLYKYYLKNNVPLYSIEKDLNISKKKSFYFIKAHSRM